MNYLIHTSILLAGMYLFYWLLLRKEAFFGLNRWILLSALLIAVFLPILKVPASWSLQLPPPIVQVNTPATTAAITSPDGAVLTAPGEALLPAPNKARTAESSQPSGLAALGTGKLLFYLYLLGVAVFTIAFLIQFGIVLRKRKNLESIKDGRCTIYELTDDTPPFSFANWVFINPAKYDGETFEQILAHEKLHVFQAHTFDKLLSELVVIVCWFNPFAWLLRSAITKNLEYLTDAEMLNAGNNPASYQLSLVKVTVPQYGLNLTTNYNESFLKKRVTMMNSKKSSARSSWKYLLLLPLLCLSIVTMNARQVATAGISAEDIANQDKPSELTKAVAKEGKGVMPIPKESGQKIHRETITHEFDLGNVSGRTEKTMTVHNITGEIKVEGYDGNTILVTVEKVIKANSDADLKDGISEIKLGTNKEEDKLMLYLDAPYTELKTRTQYYKVNDCGGKQCHNYQYSMSYHIKVPRALSLALSSINGGDIIVDDTRSRTIMAKHISNSIYLRKVTGVKDVFTVSGVIEVDFLENPTTPTSFISTSGHVVLDVVDQDFGAEVSYSSISGDLISSFPVKNKRKNGFMSASNGSVTVGRGGETMELRSISGNLVLK